MAAPEVSGRAFLGIINHVREAHGREALTQAIGASPQPTRTVFAGRILHGNWYPYAACIQYIHTEAQGAHNKPSGSSSGPLTIELHGTAT